MKTEKRAVVLALDGSEVALRGLEPARRIADALGADLEVIYVVESPVLWPEPQEPILAGDFTEGGNGWNPEVRALMEGDWPEIPGARIYVAFGRAAREIACFAAERKAEVIVLASHGRTGLPRAVLGSVAEECMRISPTPVLVIPAAGKKPPRRRHSASAARVGGPWEGVPFRLPLMPSRR